MTNNECFEKAFKDFIEFCIYHRLWIFSEKEMDKFWVEFDKKYPEIAAKALY